MDSPLTMTNCSLVENQSPFFGGGADAPSATLTDCTISASIPPDWTAGDWRSRARHRRR